MALYPQEPAEIWWYDLWKNRLSEIDPYIKQMFERPPKVQTEDAYIPNVSGGGLYQMVEIAAEILDERID